MLGKNEFSPIPESLFVLMNKISYALTFAQYLSTFIKIFRRYNENCRILGVEVSICFALRARIHESVSFWASDRPDVFLPLPFLLLSPFFLSVLLLTLQTSCLSSPFMPNSLDWFLEAWTRVLKHGGYLVSKTVLIHHFRIYQRFKWETGEWFTRTSRRRCFILLLLTSLSSLYLLNECSGPYIMHLAYDIPEFPANLIRLVIVCHIRSGCNWIAHFVPQEFVKC